MSYHRYQSPTHGSFVCARDETMTPQDCEQMVVKFSARDVVKVSKAVNEAFAETRRQLEVHRPHRVCFIRLSGVDNALQGLATAENMIHDVFDYLTPASNRYRTAGLLGRESWKLEQSTSASRSDERAGSENMD